MNLIIAKWQFPQRNIRHCHHLPPSFLSLISFLSLKELRTLIERSSQPQLSKGRRSQRPGHLRFRRAQVRIVAILFTFEAEDFQVWDLRLTLDDLFIYFLLRQLLFLAISRFVAFFPAPMAYYWLLRLKSREEGSVSKESVLILKVFILWK